MDLSYSIIIPHKNSSKLLNRLLSSIPANPDYQIIVIDDNSTKDEYEEVKKLLNNRTFELYQNAGNGAGGARNTGLKYAKGKWLMFADADDFYLPTFYELTQKYKNDNADIIYFKVESCYSDTLKKTQRDRHINQLFEKYEKSNDENIIRCRYTPPWGKMIKRELIINNKILFEECIAGNDNWFSVNTGIKAKEIKIINIPIYCVTSSSGSITTTFTKEKFNARFYSTLRTNKFLRENRMYKYQLSILYYLGKAYTFGIHNELEIIIACIKYKANPFIGINKLLKIKQQISQREDKNLLKK